MYRRKVKKVKEPKIKLGATLEELGYKLDDRDMIVDMQGKPYAFDYNAKDKDGQIALSDALTDALSQIVEERLIKDYNFIRYTIPVGLRSTDKTTPRTHIMMTSNLLTTARRVLLLISHLREPSGLWSRRLTNYCGLPQSSMLDTIRLALEQGFDGVLMTSPNWCWIPSPSTTTTTTSGHDDGLQGKATLHIPSSNVYQVIQGQESPERHVEYLFDQVLNQASNLKELYVMSHHYGNFSISNALLSSKQRFEKFSPLIQGLALMQDSFSIPEVSAGIDGDDGNTFRTRRKPSETDLVQFRSWWRDHAVNFKTLAGNGEEDEKDEKDEKLVEKKESGGQEQKVNVDGQVSYNPALCCNSVEVVIDGLYSEQASPQASPQASLPRPPSKGRGVSNSDEIFLKVLPRVFRFFTTRYHQDMSSSQIGSTTAAATAHHPSDNNRPMNKDDPTLIRFLESNWDGVNVVFDDDGKGVVTDTSGTLGSGPVTTAATPARRCQGRDPPIVVQEDGYWTAKEMPTVVSLDSPVLNQSTEAAKEQGEENESDMIEV